MFYNNILYFVTFTNEVDIKTIKTLKDNPNSKFELKAVQIQLIKDTTKLMNEIDSSQFVTHFKRLSVGFKLLNEIGCTDYSESEIMKITQIFQKAFQLRFKGNIIVNDTQLNTNFSFLKDQTLDPDYIEKINFEYDKKFNSFVAEFLQISNFEGDVVRIIKEMFSFIQGQIANQLLDSLFNLIVSQTFTNLDEALTVFLLFSLLLQNSKCKELYTQPVFEYFINDPFQKISIPKSLTGNEQKLLLDHLAIQITVSSYQV